MNIVPQGSPPDDMPERGMTVKIRSVLVVLLFFLVFGNTFMSSYFTITIGAEAVEETKEVGDEGISAAFLSGGDNVAYMTKEFMIKVADDASSQIAAHLGMSTAVTEYLAGYVASYEASIVKSPSFLEDFIVQTNSLARANSPRGITEYGLLFLKDGHLFYTTVMQDPLTTSNPVDGYHHFISIMTVNSTHYAERTIDTHGVQSTAPCDLTSNEIGHCLWSSDRIEDDGETQTQIIQMMYRALGEPGKILWAPIHGVLSSVRTLTITSFRFNSGYEGTHGPAALTDLAVVWSSVVTDGLSALLKSMSLPVDSRLYCLDIDSEDVLASRLAGANRGSAYYEYIDSHSGHVRRLPTMAVNSTDPVIREHSKWLLSGNITKGVISDWVYEPEDRLNWEAVDTLTDRHGLLLHIVLLVPQDVVMSNITRKTLEVEQYISDQYTEMESKRDNKYKVMFTLVTLVPVCLLLLSVIVAQRLMLPIEVLSEHMAAVSTMQLNIQEGEDFSRLEEVATMQHSFKRMVDALKEYRSYLPQTILMSDDSDTFEGSLERRPEADITSNGDKERGSRSDGGSGPSQGSEGATDTTSQKRSSSQRHAYPDAMVKEKLSVQLHTRKSAALVLLNTKGFTAFCMSTTTKLDAVMWFHKIWLEACLMGVRKFKGVVERFIADEVQVSFGAASHGVQCSVNACRYVCDARGKLEMVGAGHTGPKTFIGIASGKVLAGTLGCAVQRGPAVIGQAVHEVRLMRQLAVHINLDTVTSQSVYDEAKTHFHLVAADVISVAERPSTCYHLVAAFPEDMNTEWMYALQDQAGSGSWGAAFEKLLEGSIRNALPALTKAVRGEAEPEGGGAREKRLIAYKEEFLREIQNKDPSAAYAREYHNTFV